MRTPRTRAVISQPVRTPLRVTRVMFPHRAAAKVSCWIGGREERGGGCDGCGERRAPCHTFDKRQRPATSERVFSTSIATSAAAPAFYPRSLSTSLFGGAISNPPISASHVETCAHTPPAPLTSLALPILARARVLGLTTPPIQPGSLPPTSKSIEAVPP